MSQIVGAITVYTFDPIVLHGDPSRFSGFGLLSISCQAVGGGGFVQQKRTHTVLQRVNFPFNPYIDP